LSGASLEVEIIGEERSPGFPSREQIRSLCLIAATAAGISRGHLAVEFVDSDRIRSLNREHRGLDEPTDVLSFPIDGVLAATYDGADLASRAPPGQAAGDAHDRPNGSGPAMATADIVPLELGDVVICPQHTDDMPEAIVHGVLHLAGMDHERDAGEMLALQAQLLSSVKP
jgi:probable rRNA maturation factor